VTAGSRIPITPAGPASPGAEAGQRWRLLMRAGGRAGSMAGVRAGWRGCRAAMIGIVAEAGSWPGTAARDRELAGPYPGLGHAPVTCGTVPPPAAAGCRAAGLAARAGGR